MNLSSTTIANAPAEQMSLSSRWPFHDRDEIEAVMDVLASGRTNSLVHGDQTKAFEEEFARFVGADHAIAVANGTLALELALKALGIGPGDEVIVPARSFFATAACVVAAGAEPVFADVDPVSQNICPQSVERMISAKTRAVICVHLAGWPCDMDALLDLCNRHGLFLVEDCAQAHGASIGGRLAGSIGHAAAFSFCTDKIMSTGGEGGMFVTSDRDIFLKAWAYKDHGKSYQKVNSGGGGSAFRYIHDSFGSNFRMTEMQSAIGRAQLAKLPDWLARRRANAELLNGILAGHPLVAVPQPPADTVHAWYKYNITIDLDGLQDKSSVNEIVDELRSHGITCGTGTCPDMSREDAFTDREVRTDQGLPNAHKVGKANLMLAIDHMFDQKQIQEIGALVRTAIT
ncbi:dTDP-4-amino-4,6-dideoxygalactose transaminase [Altererythrobacter atlanticus]|uniref:L-glutamine:scyllo-inosose aminotransferase n=1 Tax=Croceibacterium atlanticum TaxID=1267766 RepID=A0A0F7KQP0_9SPHN|nr:DegT/DnrJ/EryC1/StrS family aminotransferase [Croceibacterium atlanticum]AKH42853.1 L-glutamine:scyllo-inosose aminotransferase [Croceibacterium atlanticum]MBB5731633.1 dTDP-4-amino-4,6-dideoxygalactose transaminase [Croceibacterium atlanticum]